MECERKGDFRIIIIYTLIFFFTICGGIFLCLYIFLPVNQSESWYPVAGMALVASPWLFWFSAYLYYLFKPCFIKNNQQFSTKGSRTWTGPNNAALTPSPKAEISSNEERRVHFGGVVVLGDDGVKREAHGAVDDGDGKEEGHSVANSESEMPLRPFDVPSCHLEHV